MRDGTKSFTKYPPYFRCVASADWLQRKLQTNTRKTIVEGGSQNKTFLNMRTSAYTATVLWGRGKNDSYERGWGPESLLRQYVYQLLS